MGTIHSDRDRDSLCTVESRRIWGVDRAEISRIAHSDHPIAAPAADGMPRDAVLCIAAGHAFGGLHDTLDAVRRHLRPGGCALLGERAGGRDFARRSPTTREPFSLIRG
jgi:hypothetical protein